MDVSQVNVVSTMLPKHKRIWFIKYDAVNKWDNNENHFHGAADIDNLLVPGKFEEV